MIVVDRELEAREREGRPIRVGMVGAGFMARGIALQLAWGTPGIRLVAIANRRPERARQAFRDAGVDAVETVESAAGLDRVIERGAYAVTADPHVLCAGEHVDVILEVTGSVEFAAHVVLQAIEHTKHVVLMNAEVDATVGPILKEYADRAGVVLTNADGDQPGVIMNLYRFVKGIGLRPVLCGNIKGLHDPYRTPTTQQEFARRWGQKPEMVTSFADGSKISCEQAIVANATGMRVARRGMLGPTVPPGTLIEEAVRSFDLETLAGGNGIVDYVVGAAPGPGVFVLGTTDHELQRHYLRLYKLGDGPLYCFYRPYHLCHFEVQNSIARAVLFRDATIAPRGLFVEVVAAAKRALRAGDVIDGIGGFTIYGLCENAPLARAEGLLPLGLAEGARVRRDIPQDRVLTLDDVELPPDRLSDRLWREQRARFLPSPAPSTV